MGKTRYFKHWKYRNLWMNNKGKGDKNAMCLHFLSYVLNICRKFAFLISHSVPTCLRWGVMSYGFCCKYLRFPTVLNFWKSVKIWQSYMYREFKGGNFFETQCISLYTVISSIQSQSWAALSVSLPQAAFICGCLRALRQAMIALDVFIIANDVASNANQWSDVNEIITVKAEAKIQDSKAKDTSAEMKLNYDIILTFDF